MDRVFACLFSAFVLSALVTQDVGLVSSPDVLALLGINHRGMIGIAIIVAKQSFAFSVLVV